MVITTVPSTTGIFTPPPSCQSLWTYEPSAINDVPGGLLIQNAGFVSWDSKCFPSSVYGYWRLSASDFYSPGWCPQGYYTPVSAVSEGTTLIICCRSSFSYTATFLPTSNSILVAGCLSTFSGGSGTVVSHYVDVNSSTLGLTSVTGPLTMWGQPMQFAYQQKDIALFVTSTSSSLTTSPSSTAQPSQTMVPTASITTVTTASTSGRPSSSPTGGTHLSGGAYAGIGIVCTLAAVSLLGLVLFILWRKKSRKSNTHEASDVSAPGMQDYSDQPIRRS